MALALSLAAATTSLAEQTPMTFRSVSPEAPDCGARCPQVVVADGVIDETTPQAFAEFARQKSLSRRPRSIVFLNSPGGNVVAAMDLGRGFRRARVAAIVAGYASQGGISGPVPGECLSACVYALMGAFRRVAPSWSRVALHRMWTVEPAEGPARGGRRSIGDPNLAAMLARYAAQMGVDPALVRRAESLAPDVLQTLSPQEIARWRLGAEQL